MLTDDDARTLLHRAADTIDVDPASPLLTTPPRPRWPMLVAAAAVLAVAAGSFALSRDHASDPAPAAPTTRTPVEQAHVLDPDQIPSLIGYKVDEAAELLEGMGLRVTSAISVNRCQPYDLVIGTSPHVGHRFERGDTVALSLTTQGQGNCVSDPQWRTVWSMIRFARGLDGPPAMAPHLRLFVGTQVSTITAAQAQDPDAWTLCRDGVCHSALAAIEQMATTTGPPYGQHRVVVQDFSFGPRGGWPLDRFWIQPPVDGQFAPALSISIGTDPESGTLAQVALELPEDITEPGLVVSLTQRAVATQFVSWARGAEQPPPFADQVELLLDDDPWATLTAEEAASRLSWSYCSGLSSDMCEVDPLRILDEYEGPVVQTGRLAVMCAPDPRHLPGGLADAVDAELVRLDQPEPWNCRDDAFAVELWVTENGEIRAVNLINASP